MKNSRKIFEYLPELFFVVVAVLLTLWQINFIDLFPEYKVIISRVLYFLISVFLIYFLMVLLICLAYSGVHFSDKPVTWMPAALSVCLIILIVGFAWAYHPLLLRIESAPKRYTVQTTLTVISVVVAAYLGYSFFVNMWLQFGGRI